MVSKDNIIVPFYPYIHIQYTRIYIYIYIYIYISLISIKHKKIYTYTYIDNTDGFQPKKRENYWMGTLKNLAPVELTVQSAVYFIY